MSHCIAESSLSEALSFEPFKKLHMKKVLWDGSAKNLFGDPKCDRSAYLERKKNILVF